MPIARVILARQVIEERDASPRIATPQTRETELQIPRVAREGPYRFLRWAKITFPFPQAPLAIPGGLDLHRLLASGP